MKPTFDVASRPLETERQRTLFDALVGLYLERGFAGLTIEETAALLRCSKSTLYALASSREQLVRAVVVSFFRSAAERVDDRVARESDPARRVEAYLLAVADELGRASAAFMDDVATFEPARELYERNTRIASERVRALITAGVDAGAFRAVPAAFVGDVVSAAMVRIQQGETSSATGLSAAEAYRALAELVVNGIRR